MCLNPAYRRWLPDVNAALAPVLAEVAGLPGAPVRVTQVAAAYRAGHGGPPQVISLGGSPPVLHLSLGLLNMPGPCGFCGRTGGARQFNGQLRLASPRLPSARARPAATAAQLSRPCRRRCCKAPASRSPRSPG